MEVISSQAAQNIVFDPESNSKRQWNSSGRPLWATLWLSPSVGGSWTTQKYRENCSADRLDTCCARCPRFPLSQRGTSVWGLCLRNVPLLNAN